MLIAVSVKIDTPMDTSLMALLTLHMHLLYDHDLLVYTVTYGMHHKIITKRSPSVTLRMYVLDVLRMVLYLMNTKTNVPLPRTPVMIIIMKMIAIKEVPFQFEYGT